MKIDRDQLKWFAVRGVNGVDASARADACAFTAHYGARKYSAYGRYTSLDEYAVIHGPTQDDVAVISALLDQGFEPTAEVSEVA